MHVAMIGTRGVPAQYGGFETAVEEVGRRLVSRGHQVTVYCRNTDQASTEHLGMQLVNLPAVRKRALETLSHTGLSVAHAAFHRPDAAVLFNAGNAPFISVLKAARIPTAVHVDGLEWKRAKWAGFGSRYYKWAEGHAAKHSLALIADAQGIADYLHRSYGRPSWLITYGAPLLNPGSDRLSEFGIEPRSFHAVVARMEPENHVREIVEGYRQSNSRNPLVVVGSAPYGDAYIKQVRSAAGTADVRFVGPIWDQELLNQIYANALSYLHGHSVGGTNPSLLRALGCASPVTAFDVDFNREVSAGNARFFSDPTGVAAAIAADDARPDDAVSRGQAGQAHAAVTYQWDEVAARYEELFLDLARRR